MYFLYNVRCAIDSTIFIKTTAMHCINKCHENDKIKNTIITTTRCLINK